MSWVDQSFSPSPFSDLSQIILALRELVVGVFGRGVIGRALMDLIIRRLCPIPWKIERLAARLAARFAAGQVRIRAARVAGAGVSATAKTLSYPRPAPIWPRQSAWLVRWAGYQAAGRGSQFRHLLGHPEMVALLQGCPQAARVLRPMCRMLGVETSLLYPGVPPKAVVEKVAVAKPKRVRRKAEPLPAFRTPFPRGVLSAVRRSGYKPVW